MDDLKILKDIGVKEIYRKTHIEPDFLGHFINKDYEKLARVNVNGYIKILQREYSLDLSEWLREYNEYCETNNLHAHSRASVSPKLEAYTANGASSRRLSSGSFGWILWVAIVLIFAVASYFFEAHKYIDQLPNIFEDKNRSASYSDSSIVQEVAKNMSIEQNVSIALDGANDDKNFSVQVSLEPQKQIQAILNHEEIPAVVKVADENLSAPEVETQEPENAEPLAPEVAPSEPKDEAKAEPQTEAENEQIGTLLGRANSAIIVPKRKVWSGVVNLKTKSKSSGANQKELKLNLKDELLVVYGNGNIVLKINGEEKGFDAGRPARFLVKNGEIRFLSYDEFVNLNGGKSW